jgi:hypothetical protein
LADSERKLAESSASLDTKKASKVSQVDIFLEEVPANR